MPLCSPRYFRTKASENGISRTHFAAESAGIPRSHHDPHHVGGATIRAIENGAVPARATRLEKQFVDSGHKFAAAGGGTALATATAGERGYSGFGQLNSTAQRDCVSTCFRPPFT